MRSGDLIAYGIARRNTRLEPVPDFAKGLDLAKDRARTALNLLTNYSIVTFYTGGSLKKQGVTTRDNVKTMLEAFNRGCFDQEWDA